MVKSSVNVPYKKKQGSGILTNPRMDKSSVFPKSVLNPAD